MLFEEPQDSPPKHDHGTGMIKGPQCCHTKRIHGTVILKDTSGLRAKRDNIFVIVFFYLLHVRRSYNFQLNMVLTS